MCETMFFFSVQVCLNPWTVQRQADLRMYLFLGGKGMFLCFYVKKIVPVDMALERFLQPMLHGCSARILLVIHVNNK
jgi:hypothetical protein